VKRYLALLAVAVAAGALALAVGRNLRAHARLEPAAVPSPEAALEITIMPGEHIVPATASVPKDHMVKLSVTNHGARRASLTLMGYQDRFQVAALAPDSTWRGMFLADRPGDDFAWMLDGAPAGRLAVTGSHLVDGHR
jgi:hypothetical protein